jgi:hypothetical protein
MRSEAADELHGRVNYDLLISHLVLGKPLAVIMPLQLA